MLQFFKQSKNTKNFLLAFLTLGIIASGSLLQSRILKVSAAVQVLLVSHTAIPFGAVFPGEQLAETYTVQLDTSANAATYTTSLQSLPNLKNLCPFLTIASIDDPSEGDGFAAAFLTRPGDTLDRWQVKLNVPGIKGQLSQDHKGGIIVEGGDFGCKITIITTLGKISGTKFNDLNGNGIKEAGEPGLAGWVINLSGGISTSTATDALGNYSFDELPANTYRVCEVQQSGWTQTFPASGFACPGGIKGYAVILGSGQVVAHKDFGNKTNPVVTRTQGFWATHTQFTSNIFQTKLGGNMPIGSSPHKGSITNIQSPSQSQLFGAFYSSIPKKTNNQNRNNTDKARMRLLQQLVAAKLNCAAFGCTSAASTLISNADVAFAAGNIANMNASTSALDTYNNSGDGQPIPPALGSPGSATPGTSQSWANKVFWDAP